MKTGNNASHECLHVRMLRKHLAMWSGEEREAMLCNSKSQGAS